MLGAGLQRLGVVCAGNPDGIAQAASVHASGLDLRRIEHSYVLPDRAEVEVLAGIELQARDGEVVAVLGPSGCGKTTLFNIIAGLLRPDAGEVLLDGKSIAGSTGHVAYMMQKDLLLKWRTVLENVTIGIEIAGENRRRARERARALLPRFGLAGFEDCYPGALSGGMRQRAALLRTILCDKPVLLLDEPFGALDALTRASMHEWLLGIWQEFRRTVVLITHDPDEAVYLADKIYVLSARPARIKGVIDVSFARPRRLEDLKSARFAEIKYTIFELVRSEID
jgi:ABC-type nitrate/sulfonate/bicarbonate transport system ATPase subunit